MVMWRRSEAEANHVALPNAACPGLHRKPLDAAIRWLLAPYHPNGRHDNNQQNDDAKCSLFAESFDAHRNAITWWRRFVAFIKAPKVRDSCVTGAGFVWVCRHWCNTTKTKIWLIEVSTHDKDVTLNPFSPFQSNACYEQTTKYISSRWHTSTSTQTSNKGQVSPKNELMMPSHASTACPIFFYPCSSCHTIISWMMASTTIKGIAGGGGTSAGHLQMLFNPMTEDFLKIYMVFGAPSIYFFCEQ